ncbi:hypothetical protein [Streptomyces sp. S.PNR 29]|uniref:hypothetical protein n=1 Tax=Streptomyces sp. S.PNR 29 TaxID=2973805 RepID=UPI0025B01625|nr:hypothetical protein [Streptomyces sp. S.PNR 29]MDN0196260.1 hypothetical protein [Streptomyces sp. S.PNR 29]
MSPMASGSPENGPGDSGLTVGPPKKYAAGIPAVVQSLRHGGRQTGAKRTLLTLLSVNQKTSKSVVVRLVRRGTADRPAA